MKPIFAFLVLTLIATLLYAQNDSSFATYSTHLNPFKKVGIDEKVLVIRGYDFMDENPRYVTYFGWVYDRETKKIIAKAEEPEDTAQQVFDKEKSYRWLSMDPVLKAYESPYVGIGNNPILWVDPDGREVKAYTQDDQNMVLDVLNYTFGSNHGFSFVDNSLVHNGNSPSNMTSQQGLMFKYFDEVLVKSKTVTTFDSQERFPFHITATGEVLMSESPSQGGAATYYFPESKLVNGKYIMYSKPAENLILVSDGLLAKNGIDLEDQNGTKTFSFEHAVLHEFAHAMMYVIMNEMNGTFNGVDFNSMTETERSDWAIQYTNTLLQSQNKPLETGGGQHGRPSKVIPTSPVGPLTE